MKNVLKMTLSIVLTLAILVGCGNSGDPNRDINKKTNDSEINSSDSNSEEETVNLKFMYWGGAEEKVAVEKMVQGFNEQNKDKISVEAQHVPDEYAQKLSSLIASNQAPDIAYVPSGSAVQYALDGTILFIEDVLGDDKTFLEGVLPNDKWVVNGKTAFLSTAHETLMITYNKDIFDDLNIPYPPTEFEKALKWDEFVELCKKLTVDRDGNNALSTNFNKDEIKHYGFSMTYGINNWYPLLKSLGGDILNEDSSKTTFDSSEMIDLMTKLQNLTVKDHVSPTMTDVSSNPDPTEMMLTGQVAMIIDGNWSFITYAEEKFNVGCTFLPDMGSGPHTLSAPGVTAMFSQTKYPKEAFEFYKFSLDTEKGATDLYKNGLWQPIYKEYYTNKDKIASWAQTGSRPEEFVNVVVNNIEKNVVLMPSQFIKDYSQIGNVVNPAIDAIFRGESDPVTALKDAQKTIEDSSFYAGRFD